MKKWCPICIKEHDVEEGKEVRCGGYVLDVQKNNRFLVLRKPPVKYESLIALQQKKL